MVGDRKEGGRRVVVERLDRVILSFKLMIFRVDSNNGVVRLVYIEICLNCFI